MLTGKVEWFSLQKEYDFISPDDGNKDIFIHISAFKKSLFSFLN